MKKKHAPLSVVVMVLSLILFGCAGTPAEEPVEPTDEPVAEETDEAEEPTAEEPMEEDEPEPTEEPTEEEMEHFTIGMMVIAPVPALETVQESFIETLAEGGYVGVTVGD